MLCLLLCLLEATDGGPEDLLDDFEEEADEALPLALGGPAAAPPVFDPPPACVVAMLASTELSMLAKLSLEVLLATSNVL